MFTSLVSRSKFQKKMKASRQLQQAGSIPVLLRAKRCLACPVYSPRDCPFLWKVERQVMCSLDGSNAIRWSAVPSQKFFWECQPEQPRYYSEQRPMLVWDVTMMLIIDGATRGV